MKNYVKKYMGHDVPCGATHYTEESFFQRAGFYKWENGQLMFKPVAFRSLWVKSINYEIPSCAIELPEEPKSEWMPKVGEECVVSYPYEDGNFKCFDGEKVLIISCGRCEMTSEYIYTGHNAKHGYVALSAKGYHPLKTEEEKKREYNYGEILKILNLINSSDFCPVEAASVLAHEGFTAPEGEL